MRTYALLIFPCFLEAWREINTLTITDSSSLRLRKLAYHQQQPLKAILVIRMANHPLHPISHCQPPPSSQQGKTFIQSLVLRVYYLPCDQQSCLSLNRTAFQPLHFCFYVSSICHFFNPVCSQKLSRVIHRPIFSCLEGAQFADCITSFATNHFVLV